MTSLRFLGWLPSGGASSREELHRLASRRVGYESDLSSMYPLLWRGKDRRALGRGLWWEEGWSLTAVALGDKRSAVGLLPRRLYFDQAAGGKPSRVREFELLGDRQRPRGLAPAPLLREGCALLRELSEGREPLALSPLEPSLTEEITIRIRERELPVRDRLAGYCENHGMDVLPQDARIALVPESGVSEAAARLFLEALIQSLRRRKADEKVQVQVRSVAELASGLAAGGGYRGIGVSCDANAVWFLLRGKVVDPGPKMLEFFRRLDSVGIPWRRAYADDPRAFSVRDQTGSLLQAVGGVPHRVGLKGARTLPWSLGVDLSHKREAGPSRLCVTLVDPEGRLRGAWCREQVRDETARTETLRPLLREAASKLRASGGAEMVLVIRDGRFFENEVPSLYRGELGTKVELLELVKNGTPPLFEISAGGDPVPPKGAVAGLRPDGDWVYLLSGVTQEVGSLESALKFRRTRGGDSSMFSDQSLAEALVALTYAPSLGSRRSRFPAPIYWADGIAGASDSDLRFRGQSLVQVLQ